MNKVTLLRALKNFMVNSQDIKTSKTALISQVRMTSTRLPGKVLKKVNHKTLLDYHFSRLKKSGLPLIIATTTNIEDDPVEDWCKANNVRFHRGSENNVLSRYYETAKKFNLKHIIRVTSDCPLIDGEIIKDAYSVYQKENNDFLYLSNVIDRTYPRGFDFEIFSFQNLQIAFEKATDPSDLEHVTPYINKNKSGQVQFYHYKNLQDFSDWRITVDTPDDFKLIEKLILDFNADQLNTSDFFSVLSKNSNLKLINAHIEQKKL
jgi:spore coat polysaccharide biosynthesis protein SpsF